MMRADDESRLTVWLITHCSQHLRAAEFVSGAVNSSAIIQNENKTLPKLFCTNGHVSPDSSSSFLSLCLPISSFYFFFSLSRLIDWLIKPITEITKSNQVQTSATCRLVEKQEYVGGAGTRPNAAEQIRPKTEQLQAKAILREF